ncbi:MAG: EF-hand domain-containing protein [Acidimicrobiia bacterium]
MSDGDKTREDFDEIDTDDDGYITVSELKASLEGDPNVSDDHVATIAGLADKDGDDKITYEEYAKFVR